MGHLDDLASAANQAGSYRRRPLRPRAARRQSSGPLGFAIIFAAIVIAGAIIYLATHSKGPSPSQATSSDVSSAEDQLGSEVAGQQVKAQVAQFKDFAARLAEALSHTRKLALQTESTTPDLVVTYTCRYLVGHLGTQNAASGRPATFLAQFSGAYDGKGEGYFSKDTCELNAGFTFDRASGRWKIASATERALTHSTSSDFMGMPEKGGPKRDIANIDWFNAAVAEAQK
jgi:hypothetical protein